MTTILIKKKDTSGAPAPGDLTNAAGGAEIAVNTADKRLYSKNSGGTIVEIGTNPATFQINSAYTFPTSDGTANQVLRTNGSGALSFATVGAGTVTSVEVSGGTTGLTTSGGPITSSGTITIAGTLAVTNGGTGLTTVAQGDLIYASASNTLTVLAKNTTATRYLANTGTSNNPAWAQIDLSNGVTGDLPFANLTQIAGLSVLGVTGSSTADVAAITAASDHQVVRRSGSAVAFGAVNLASTNAVTGTLAVGNGGTGITSFGTGIATWLGTPSSANLAAAVTDETGSGALVFATTPVITGLREKSAAVAASDIDLSLGNYFTKTISATTTFTVSNVATSGDVAAFILVLTNGGVATVNWFSGVTWNNATPPTLTTSGIDILGFFTINGGTTWRGLVLAQAVA